MLSWSLPAPNGVKVLGASQMVGVFLPFLGQPDLCRDVLVCSDAIVCSENDDWDKNNAHIWVVVALSLPSGT